MCIDAMQFAVPYSAGVAEAARVLGRGGRLVLTGWLPRDPSDPAVPERLRVDIEAELAAGGFRDVTVQPRPDWDAAERRMWEAAVAEDPAGDAALESMKQEGIGVLSRIDRQHRVLVRGIRR